MRTLPLRFIASQPPHDDARCRRCAILLPARQGKASDLQP
jgi:hypothetical protein